MRLTIFLIVFATSFTNSLLANNLSSPKNPTQQQFHHPEHQRISQQPVIPPEQDHAIPAKAGSSKDFDASVHQKNSTTHDQNPPLVQTSSKKNSEEILVDLNKPEHTSTSQQQPSKKEIAADIIAGGAGATGVVIGGGGIIAGIVGGSLGAGIGGTKVLEIAEDKYGDLKYGAEPELQVEEQGDAS